MIALITGASAGIGAACAQKFAQNGYDIIITGRRQNRLDNLKSKIEQETKAQVYTLTFDVGNQKKVTKALNSLPNKWQYIDVLVNNAGLALGKEAFQDASITDFDNMIQTNVNGLLYVSKWVIEKMKLQKSGHIINISSTAAKEVYPGGHVYCATKHAVDAITKGMRIDLLPLQIKVSSVSPGMVETEFSKVRFKGDEERAKNVYKGFKPLYAEDVADVVYYTANLPTHVCINDVVLTSTAQANSYLTLKNE